MLSILFFPHFVFLDPASPASAGNLPRIFFKRTQMDNVRSGCDLAASTSGFCHFVEVEKRDN